MASDALLSLLAQARGNPTLLDLQQQRAGVELPTAEGYRQMGYGIPSGAVGLAGDVESMFRDDTLFPTSEDVGSWLGADTESTGFQAGTFLSPDPLSKLTAGLGLLAIPARRFFASDFVPVSSKTGQKQFAAAQQEARGAMSPQDRAQVDPFNPEEFSGTVYMTPEGDAGFSMTDEGYLGHLFKHPNSPRSDAMSAVLTKGRAEGGKNMDAFDTYLAESYKKRGAVETGRSPWDPDYATEEMIDALAAQNPDYVSLDIGGVFPERKHSEILGPRAQEPLERYKVTPTGKPVKEPAAIADMFTPEKKDRIKQLVQKGVEMGGDKWYESGGIADRFVEVLGPEEGPKKFEQFMQYAAGVSPRSTVAKELQRASVLYNRAGQGQPVAPLDPSMFPPGYGHLGTRTAHAPNIGRVEETGRVGTGVDQPKVTAYGENRMGNYRPMTIDTHIMQTLSGKKKSPSKVEYGFIEDRLTEMADEMGMDPAEFQAALWVGAAEETGVANPQNITKALNQRVAKTAEHHGISEQEAMENFIKQEMILRALMGSVGTGAIASGMMFEEDTGMQ